MVVVSYYTDDYADYAKGLISSLDRYGLKHSVERRDSKNGWRKNCQQKADYILEKLNQFNEPVCWIDADAQVKQMPHILFNLNTDIAVRIKPSGRYMSGTVWFNNNDNARNILNRWIEINSTCDSWDQKTLQQAVNGESLYRLPDRYCAKFDENIDGVVIKHYMASRELRDG